MRDDLHDISSAIHRVGFEMAVTEVLKIAEAGGV
jgi:hypothetical protein